MHTIATLLLNGLAVLISSYIIPGTYVDGFLSAILVSVVLSLVNMVIKPIVVLLTLPINILTLGLFSFFITALMVMLVSALLPGFTVDGYLAAALFGIVLSVVNNLLLTLLPNR
jgi:putative membrane protein